MDEFHTQERLEYIFFWTFSIISSFFRDLFRGGSVNPSSVIILLGIFWSLPYYNIGLLTNLLLAHSIGAGSTFTCQRNFYICIYIYIKYCFTRQLKSSWRWNKIFENEMLFGFFFLFDNFYSICRGSVVDTKPDTTLQLWSYSYIAAELTARMAFTNPINLLYLLFTWLNLTTMQ